MRSHHHHPRRSFHDASWRGMRQKKRYSWVPYSLRVHGGGIHIPQILVSGMVAALICYLSADVDDKYSLHSPILFPVFGFIIALSISFRMSSAYSRWWEGRTEWDKISALSRNIARTLWLHVPEQKPSSTVQPSDADTKQYAITLLHAFAVALKHHLRGQRDWDKLDELKKLLSHLPHYHLVSGTDSTNHPVQITLHIAAYLEHVRQTRPVDTQVFTHLLLYIDSLTACISACERLLRTPIPLGYNIAISRIVWIFVLVLPSQLYDTLGWMTVGVTMLTAYVLFALSEVGLEIENPWGEGPNNLDLDRYCLLIAWDLADITARPHREYERWIHDPAQPVYDPSALIGMGRAAFTTLGDSTESTESVDLLV